MLDENSVMLLNDIIYKIYTVEPFDKMRKQILSALNFLIPFSISTFYLTSDENPYELTRPIGTGMPDSRWEVYIDKYQELDYTRWTFAAPTSKAYRETDLLNEEVRINTPFYKSMYAPSNIHYSVILTIIHNGKFLGVITLFRKKDEQDFSDKEVLLLDLLKDHLGYRLSESMEKYREKRKNYPTSEKLTKEYNLTPREIEVVYLLLDGVNREDMCNQLCISTNTLKKHTLNIYKKLNIKSWRELFKLIK
ncbi:helix-turn-helix transcriptional regulator [Anaerovorax odorimutans]|uniref:helix-turn-helix transcriptional regulator n=1 Tax=Anaerovorax odorimutans TaxID=109327 RepID=UPI000427FC90|nr:helix-turn-helix domain-containing protein [Anaerovorax odorimutans]